MKNKTKIESILKVGDVIRWRDGDFGKVFSVTPKKIVIDFANRFKTENPTIIDWTAKPLTAFGMYPQNLYRCSYSTGELEDTDCTFVYSTPKRKSVLIYV